MKIAYLAHPYTDDPMRNYLAVTDLAARLQQEHPDVLVFSPVHAFVYLARVPMPEQHEMAMQNCQEMMRLLNTAKSASPFYWLDDVELWLAPGWEKSQGCREEKYFAECMGWKVVEL
ncbi:MAG: hypothetical protein AB1327_08040 [Bacillota bacterium]